MGPGLSQAKLMTEMAYTFCLPIIAISSSLLPYCVCLSTINDRLDWEDQGSRTSPMEDLPKLPGLVLHMKQADVEDKL